jgi:hypothetical protein
MRKGRGQALVEFALVIGIVVILAIGAIQALYTFYLTRQVRAAAEEIANVASIYGGDTEFVRQEIPAILGHHQLDPDLAQVEIEPVTALYLDPLTVTLNYNVSVPFYGLFNLPIPGQQVQRLSEGG